MKQKLYTSINEFKKALNKYKMINENIDKTELDKIVDKKIRQWKMDAGAMSVMIYDMDDEAYNNVIDNFRKEAEIELKNKNANKSMDKSDLNNK